MLAHRSAKRSPTILVILALGFGLAALAPIAAGARQGEPTATADQTPPASRPLRAPCEDGRLLLGDLPAMDDAWRDGMRAATRRAEAWEPDARLTSLRVNCELFEPGFRWQATFYSAKAQAFFETDTGDTDPAEEPPERVPTLDAEQLSFGMVRRSLAKAGFDDADELSPSTGVEIRVNAKDSPFGPPSAPLDVVLYHVAIQRLGETKDVFVAATDGAVYRFTAP